VANPIVSIAGRQVGGDAPPLVVAEAGVNHNGDPALALALVDAAADAGADAVKFQAFAADSLASADAPQAAYQRERAPAATQLEMLRVLELSPAAWRAIRDRAVERGIAFFASPFDAGSLRLLLDLDVPAIKVGSGDLTNLPLLRAVAAAGRPVVLSTGMATLDEVEAAVAALRAAGDPPLVLLHCTSAYPAPAEAANLSAMSTLRAAFDVPVGYSDHTLGIATSIAAAALGAALVEKHLTVDRSLPGPDHAASIEPAELAALVDGVRIAHAAIGDGIKRPAAVEGELTRLARRSLVAARDLAAGATISAADLDARRPADGISPMRLDEVIGRRAARELPAGHRLTAVDLDPPLA